MPTMQASGAEHLAEAARTAPRSWPIVLALAAVVLAGGLCLPMPFWGDQSLFAVYARQITDGAVLYRDVLDIKQPGIFAFYALGGTVFGFTEVGIHLFELVYWLAFSIFSIVALRSYFTRWGAPLVPILTIVVYYLFAGLLDLTQVEILIGFPILVSWWLLDRADLETTAGLRQYLAAGVLSAVVVLLKHLYLLIILGFLVYSVARALRQQVTIPRVIRGLAMWSTGLLFPLLMVTAYFAAYGQLGRIWWAYFEFSVQAHMTTPRPVMYLIQGARRFMIGYAPILILAATGTIHAFRRRARPQIDLAIGMTLWIGLGVFALVALQGWPEYKWPLFTIPVGILALFGLETLAIDFADIRQRARAGLFVAGITIAVLTFGAAEGAPRLQTRLLAVMVVGGVSALALEMIHHRGRTSRLALVTFVGMLAAATGLAAIGPSRKVGILAEHGFARNARLRSQFQHSWSHSYRAADEDLAALRQRGDLSKSVYVFGDPVLLLHGNKPQIVPILGWGPQFLDTRGWRELHEGLRATLPHYIVVESSLDPIIRSHYSPMMDFIASNYRIAFVGASGTWYERR